MSSITKVITNVNFSRITHCIEAMERSTVESMEEVSQSFQFSV